MKKLISARQAANLLLIALGVLVVFHVLVIVGAIPADIVWGGRIGDSSENLILLEATAVTVALIFAVIIAAKIDYLKVPRLEKVVNIGTWLVFGYFVLNVIGNLASSASLETLVFTPISIALAVLSWRLAIEK